MRGLAQQKRRAKAGATEMETAEEEEDAPRAFIVKGLADAFADLSKLLKLENGDPNTESFLIHGEECSWCVICL